MFTFKIDIEIADHGHAWSFRAISTRNGHVIEVGLPKQMISQGLDIFSEAVGVFVFQEMRQALDEMKNPC